MATVVVSYVDKPEGRAALRAAMDEAGKRSAELVIVGTRRGDEDHPASDAPETFVPGDLAGELDRLGIAYAVRRAEPDAEPADELLSAAEELDADLIVIGLRRRSPVGKLMLGANAQRVLLDASCPVLTVKAEVDRPS